MHLGLDGHVTLKWEIESELFQLNQLSYNIIHFFTLFMSNGKAQLDWSTSHEFDSRWIFFNLQILMYFTSLKTFKDFLCSCGIQISF